MKVLIVNDHFHDVGGTEAYTLALCAGLRGRGIDVAGFCAQRRDTEVRLPYPVYSATRPLRNLPWRILRLYNPYARKALANVIDLERPDIIHFQNVFSRLSPAVVEACVAIPRVMTVHDYRFDCSESKLTRTGDPCASSTRYAPRPCLLRACALPHKFLYQSFRNRLARPVLRKVGKLIAPSRYMQKYLEEIFGAEVEYIPHGIDGDSFGAFPLTGNGNLLFVGRLVWEKGLTALIQAMKLLRCHRPQARLRVVGAGSGEERYKAQAKRLRLENIEFVGKIPNARIAQYYAEADVVCMPSFWPDNAPIVAYESMAAGRALVASNVGGLSDLVEDGVTGRLVPPRDVESLASAISEVLDGKAAVFGCAARRRYEQCFTLGRHLDALLSVYGRVLA